MTPELTVRRFGAADRELLERLYLMFRHDLSEFQGQLPRPDGTYRSEWLESALTGDPEWAGYVFHLGENPIGYCLMRALQQPVHVLNSFFVVRPVRRGGLGLRAVREVLAHHPGPCEIAFQDNNETAVRFWRRVAAAVAGDAWTEEHRPVGGRPDAPPDTWISFVV
ncbi:GNAT family N-acetyltransferase [Kribbella sandramycini]|uniref:Putative acetyltransferase n=1 Tax=Kribbella sandramycini TaxID=60450 RepID=A0A841SFE9_9ACTN|nr:putative acetyltransferase [Kribbella sandramycini]